MSKKEAILDAVGRLPSDASFDDAIEEIRILRAVELGEKAADQGRVVAHEDIPALLRTWIVN